MVQFKTLCIRTMICRVIYAEFNENAMNMCRGGPISGKKGVM